MGISTSEKMMIAEKYWVLLAIEFALYPRERKSDYPFNLPYFEIFNRLMEVSEMLKKIVMWNAWHNKVSWVVLKLDEYLKTLIKSSEVMILSNKIKHIRLWFEEIRKVLRVSREFIEIAEKIGDKCVSYLDELFVKVVDKNGNEIKIIRHNGMEELNHRWSRMHIRRRTGRSRTTMEMEKYGALFAVFSNIEYEDFVKTILSDVKDFVREMQNVSDAEVLDARKLIRTFPQCPLIRFDSERPVILKKLIELIGDELDDVSDIDIEGWIKNFKTEALLTP